MAEHKVVGIDLIAWMVPSKHTKSGYEHRTAARGEIVELPDNEAERLAAYLGDPDAPDEVDETDAGAWEQLPEDAIAQMTVEQVTAYLGQVPEDGHDDELARVLDIEQAREKPRAGVLALGDDFEPHEDDPDLTSGS